MKKVSVRGIHIALDYLPSGKELIVFLHGVGADRTSWKFQLPYFHALGYSVAALDMRGSGDSDARDQDGHLLKIDREEFACDVDAVITALGYDKAHWVGNSMGGVIILEALSMGLTTLEKIVLGNTFAEHTDSEAILPRAAAALTSKSLPDFAKERIPLVYKPDIDKETLDGAIYAMSRKDKDAYLASWQTTWSPDHRDLLSHITHPTLIISGSLDMITPIALSNELEKGIRHSQHITLVGAGHIAHGDQPEQYNRVVQEFLTR